LRTGKGSSLFIPNYGRLGSNKRRKRKDWDIENKEKTKYLIFKYLANPNGFNKWRRNGSNSRTPY
jgi:hypothetical protein